MSKPTVYVTRQLPEPVMTALTQRFRLTRPPETAQPTRETILDGIRDADAVICTLAEQIDASVLAEASHLRIIANYAVGYNNVDLEAAYAKHIVVTNTPDILTESTADLTWALLLATARRVTEGHDLVRQGNWTGWEPRQLLGTDVLGEIVGSKRSSRVRATAGNRRVRADPWHHRHGTDWTGGCPSCSRVQYERAVL